MVDDPEKKVVEKEYSSKGLWVKWYCEDYVLGK